MAAVIDVRFTPAGMDSRAVYSRSREDRVTPALLRTLADDLSVPHVAAGDPVVTVDGVPFALADLSVLGAL